MGSPARFWTSSLIASIHKRSGGCSGGHLVASSAHRHLRLLIRHHGRLPSTPNIPRGGQSYRQHLTSSAISNTGLEFLGIDMAQCIGGMPVGPGPDQTERSTDQGLLRFEPSKDAVRGPSSGYPTAR